MRRCSAASRVPSLTLGGCAALDPACAPSRDAFVDSAIRGTCQPGGRRWLGRRIQSGVLIPNADRATIEPAKLRDLMHAEDVCMIFLLVEATDEQLMAYQHTRPNNFFTTEGVDKLFGAQRIAEALRFDLEKSLGAGDTELDRFLAGVGLAVTVGPLRLEFKGRIDTIRLKDSFELGELLFQLAGMIGAVA